MQASLSEEETSPKIVEALIKLKVCVRGMGWSGEGGMAGARAKRELSGDIRRGNVCCIEW